MTRSALILLAGIATACGAAESAPRRPPAESAELEEGPGAPSPGARDLRAGPPEPEPGPAGGPPAVASGPEIPPPPSPPEIWSSDRGGPGRPGSTSSEGPRAPPRPRFQLPLPGEARSAPAATEAAIVLALRSGRVTAVDPRDGRQIWSKGTRAIRGSGPAVGAGLVAVAEVARNGQLHAFALEDGAPLWSERLGPSWASPALADGAVVALGGNRGDLRALDAPTGERRFGVTVRDARGSPAVAGGRVLVATARGAVALSLADGSACWEAELGAASSPAVLGDLVVVALEAGGVAALALEDGALRWRRDDLDAPVGLPALDGRRVLLVAGRALLALDATTGAELWRAPAAPGASPAVGGSTAYVLAAADRVVAVDLEDGSLLWSHALGRAAAAHPVVAHGALLLSLSVDAEGQGLLLALE